MESIWMLYSLVFDYAFVHAHDLIRTTWCRRIWIHALQPDRTMKQEIHLWNTALAPDASHHAHDPIRTTWCRRIWIHALQPDRTMKQEIHLWNSALAPDAWHHAHDLMRTTWCRWLFDCILHGCRRLISLQNMAHAMIYLLVDIRCVRMYDSLLIISRTLVHPHDTVCVRLVHSWGVLEFIHKNMKMIVLCLSMISKRFRIINQGTVECSKPGERKVNNIEEIVYALYGCTVFFVWLRLRIRWCAWSHIPGRHAVDGFETMVCNQVESWSKMSTVKHSSGSRCITSCACSHTHDMM